MGLEERLVVYGTSGLGLASALGRQKGEVSGGPEE